MLQRYGAAGYSGLGGKRDIAKRSGWKKEYELCVEFW
jgi:hypothetical protein